MWPDAPSLRVFLARASRRLTLLAALRGASVGLAIALDIALIVAIAGWSRASGRELIGVGLWLGAIGFVIGLLVASVRQRRSTSVALDIERRAPACRNVVITAAELIANPSGVGPYVGEMVCKEATRQVASLSPATLFPARSTVALLSAISTVWAIAVTAVAAHPAPRSARDGSSASSGTFANVRRIDVTITPPAYSGQPARSLHDPTRIEALAGSRIRLAVLSDGDSVVVETLDGRTALTAGDNRIFTGNITADADGFIAIEPFAKTGQMGGRRLIGLSVTPDRSPRVKIVAPGKDLFLATAKHALDISVEADDDLALASLTLRYTKVSGSGEKFTFADGEVPVVLTRAGDRTWKARGTLRLDALGLEQGDVVVYRGIASDRRPGMHPTESDAFIVEITSPGMTAAEGFSMDDAQDKYALSQQMVILKTELLLAKAPAMVADSLTYQSQTIAAEQRAVRAQFVFMMGGELAEEVIAAAGLTNLNEEAEAAGEADLAAGRMLNRGRVALVQSIRFMSRANASLNAVLLAKALTEEKAALTYLQQAFSRTRYLLRALTKREQLDLSRRLTGVLATASPDVRPAAGPIADPRITALRQTLAGIATLAAATPLGANSAALVSALAQRMLEVDPSDETLQRVASQLTAAGSAIGDGKGNDAKRLLSDAAMTLASVVRASLLNGPPRAQTAEVSRLRGELADQLRRVRDGR